jgi:hypothetical protein
MSAQLRIPAIWLSLIAFLALTLIPWGIAPARAKIVGPPEVAWKDMTFSQRRVYMKAVVTPKMKTVFQSFDAKTFKTFTCETCHGKDSVARKFKMPSPDIHPLPNTAEAFQAKMKAEPTWPRWTKFMSGEVEPAMGTLLAVPVFDPKKPVEGAFGCKACHRLESSAP